MTSTSADYPTVPKPGRTAPPRSENRARSQVVTVRIGDDERERWTAFAQSQGMSLAGLLRLSTEFLMVQQQMAEAQR